jgi:hypothetical protein
MPEKGEAQQIENRPRLFQISRIIPSMPDETANQ